MKQIRNFSIIAHIDHGKSTLADRFIQRARLVEDRQFRDQILDSMDIEREHGITIKSQTVCLNYISSAGDEFTLNLIDTPGHVDFSYEVSRALASCEGALLLIDATQGVQAQTVANMYAALEQNLTILPVINKIDLASADIERTKEEIEFELGLDSETAILCSARAGTGMEEILEAITRLIPPPAGDPDKPLAALVFDAKYDPFRGAVMSCRIFDGVVRPGDEIRLMSLGTAHRVEEVGIFRIRGEPREELDAGEVGYVIAGIKTVRDTRIGDTITLEENPVAKPLPGFREVKPVVFSSIFPVQAEEYDSLVDALERYKLNDAALVYQKDSSTALGQGFRCGFLGLLHLTIFEERLEREFDQAVIMTAPSVRYRFVLKNGETVTVDNPQLYPDVLMIERSLEPYIKATILLPERHMGAVMKLCLDRRGVNPHFTYPVPGRIELTVELPLAEVIYDFYDKLKSVTQGYGSFDYEIIDYRSGDLVKLEFLVNGEKVDALATIIHEDRARPRAVSICEKLRKEIPRHLFKVAIQGAVGGKIIARSNVAPFRKDVTAKCYGGDITRKRKLLEKQAKGKKKMRTFGQVMIPQSAFVAVLKTDTD
jgi:GTP-binding protein LepA